MNPINKSYLASILSYVILLLVAASSFSVFAQSWQPIQVGYGGTTDAVSINDGYIYVGELNNLGFHARTLISNDGGNHWTHVDTKFSDDVCDFAFDNNNHTIYFSRNGGFADQPTTVYKTTDNFKTVTPLFHDGKTFGSRCNQLNVSAGNLVVADENHIYYSSDEGQTFTQSNFAIDVESDISNLEVNDNGVLIATTGAMLNESDVNNFSSNATQGIFYSTDHGKSWQQSNAPASLYYLNHDSSVSGDVFYALAGTADGNSIFTSTDGAHWTESKISIKIQASPYANYIPITVDSKQRIFILTSTGIWMKDANNWQHILTQKKPNSLMTVFQGKLINVEYGGIVTSYSAETGKWTPLQSLPNTPHGPMISTPDAAYIQAFVSGLYKITKDNNQWQFASKTGAPSTIYYATDDHALYETSSYCNAKKSSDQGETFQTILHSLTIECFQHPVDPVADPELTAIAHLNGTTMVGAFNLKSGVVLSSDDKNFSYVQGLKQHPLQFVHTEGKEIYAAFGQNGVKRSLDGGQTWSELNQGLPKSPNIKHLTYDPQSKQLLASGNGLYQLDSTSNHWQSIGDALPNQGSNTDNIVIASAQVYVTEPDNGVYTKSLNSGDVTWHPMNTGLTSYKVSELMYFNHKLYLNDDGDIYEYALP